jgi:hypothetical protein
MAVATFGMGACGRRAVEEAGVATLRSDERLAVAPIAASPDSGHRVSIGDPCSGSDGHQLTVTGIAVANAASQGPVAMAPDPNFVDYHQLAPGIGYCIRPGEVFPHGYYTMNCAQDADCPAGATCAEGQCVSSCTSDTNCVAPARCAPHGGATICQFAAPAAAAPAHPVTVKMGSATITPGG